MVSVTFRVNGSDVVIHAAEGDNLLETARRANVAIDAPCSGNGACGKCRVKLIQGELDSPQTRHITDEEYAQGWRLSCVSKLVGDITVEVPDIASAYRSRMNVTFRTGDRDLDAQFAKEAAAAGLSNLKGHRLVGGMRASLYNAMPIEGVKALIDFMARFEKEHI